MPQNRMLGLSLFFWDCPYFSGIVTVLPGLSLFCQDCPSFARIVPVLLGLSLFILCFPAHPRFYNSSIEKPCAGSFWWKVGQMKSLDGEPRFLTLYKLMAGLLPTLCSNAGAERGFSVLRKIHTDQRSNQDQ